MNALTAQLLRVKVLFTWQTKSGRVMGEDNDMDGVLDVGEDQNANGELDANIQISTEIFGS